MNNNQRIVDICLSTPIPNTLPNYYTRKNLTPEQQHNIEEILIDYFGLKSIKWIDLPTGISDAGEIFVVQTWKVTDSGKQPKYEGLTGYMYSVTITPEIYHSSNTWNDYYNVDSIGLIKALVYPTAIDNESFTFHNEIRFKIHVDVKQDLDEEAVQESEAIILSKMMHAAVDKILESPKSFYPKGERYAMVRIAIKDDTIIKK